MKPLRSTILSLLVCFYFFSKAQISEEQTREKLLEQGTKYYESNKFDSAVFYLEKSFAIAKEALDSNDEKLGTNAYHLGKAYQAKQRLNEAEEMLLPATNVFEKTKGKEDKVYCVCLNDLGALYDDMGKLNMSIDFYEQAILNAEKSVGKEHFYYGIYTSNLAQVYESLGEYEKALPLKIAVVTNIEKSLGKEHYYYGQSLNSLADLYNKLGDFEKALPLCREAIENAEKSVGTGHPAYGSRLNILAELYISMGEYDKAIKLHKEAMTNAETNYGKNHATYAIRIGNLANAYKLTKQYEKALTLNQESIAIFEKTVGKEHHFYGQSLNNLAILYENMGEFDKSLPLQLQALEITEKSLGKENTSYVSRVANLATLYRSMGDYEKSLPLTIEALEITQRLLGNKHAIYGFYTNDMAGTYEMMGDYEKAEPYFVLANENLIHRMEQLFQFRSEKELKAFLLKTRFHFDIYQSFGYRTNGKFPSITETNLNNQLLLKGMLLNHSKDILNKLCELNDKEINKKVARLKSDKTYLTKQYSLLSNKRIAGMDSLIESVNNQEAELVKSYGDIFGQTTELAKSWREIQAKLEPKDVAIEFSHFKHRNDLDWAEDSILYIAYIIKRGWSEPKLVYLFEEKELKNILQKKSPNQLHSTRGVSLSDNASSVYFADSIYKLIWKPLMSQ